MFKYSNRYNIIDKGYKIGSLNELERENRKNLPAHWPK